MYSRFPSGADGSDRVESPWLRAEVDYLTVEVQGRHNPLSDAAVVGYVLSW